MRFCVRAVLECAQIFLCLQLFTQTGTRILPLRLFHCEMLWQLNNEDFSNSVTWTHENLGVDTMTVCKVLEGNILKRISDKIGRQIKSKIFKQLPMCPVMRDFRLPPHCKWGRDRQVVPKRPLLTTNLLCIKFQEGEDLDSGHITDIFFRIVYLCCTCSLSVSLSHTHTRTLTLANSVL